MSTFEGLIEEIPNISIDRFDGKNLESSIYFLSHCHADHMVGLNSWDFGNLLIKRKNVFMYASPVTVKILNCKFPNLTSKFRELAVNVPTLLSFPCDQTRYLIVTPITAGHCPGSVMFLFETDKNILYTGDFRVSASDLKKFCCFYQEGQLKKIHKIYLDTTFFNTSYLKFPSRRQSLDAIIRIIKEWFDANERNFIQIQTSATYGSEFLFIEIAKEFNMPIHVNQVVYDFYKHIPDMDKAVTLDSAITRLHSSCGPTYREICIRPSRSLAIRTIKPSAMYWRDWDLKQDIEDHTNENFRVCYATHSSFEELMEILMFFKSGNIEPNVLPKNVEEKRTMLNTLKTVIESYKEKEPETDNSANNGIKQFKIRDEKTVKTDFNDDENDSYLDDLLSSPPRKMRKSEI